MAISETLGGQRSIALSQGQLMYRDRGEGPPIVFLHGALVNGDVWRDVVAQLCGEYRCLTPDLPFGAHATPLAADADLTPPGVAALVLEFMRELDLRRVTLVANDAGGAVAQILVTSDASRVARLVLTSCDSFWGFPPRYLKPLRWFGLLPAMMPVVLRAAWLAPMRALMFWSAAKRPIAADVMNSWVTPMRRDRRVRRDLGKFFRDVRPRYTITAARKLREFHRPTLIAWAANDLWFPRRNARRLAHRIPDARLALAPDCRTLVPHDQPAELTQLIREFLSEQPITPVAQ